MSKPRYELNETTEMWRAIRHDRQDRRAEQLVPRTAEIHALEQQGFRVRRLTDYQFRVDEVLDLFPARRRYHHIKTQARGSYAKPFDLAVRLLRTRRAVVTAMTFHGGEQ